MIRLDKLLSNFRVWLSTRIPEGAFRVLRPFLTVQFLTFMLMGLINTVFAITVATLLDMVNNAFLAVGHPLRVFIEMFRTNFIVGYAASIVLSFFLNSRFTFHQPPTLRRFVKFPISYIPNFLIQYVLVFLFTSLHFNPTIAYIIAAVIGTPVTFVSMKFMVFRRINKTEKTKK